MPIMNAVFCMYVSNDEKTTYHTYHERRYCNETNNERCNLISYIRETKKRQISSKYIYFYDGWKAGNVTRNLFGGRREQDDDKIDNNNGKQL